MNKINVLAIIAGIFFVIGCGGEPVDIVVATPELPFELKIEQELDLKSYNLPIKIKVPKDAKVNAKKGFMPEYVIEGRGYYLQIMPIGIGTSTRKKLKEMNLAEIEARPEFSKVIVNDSFGFVYETKWEKMPLAYNFRYIYTQGETYYDLRTANSRGYTQADAVLIYNNIKQE